MVSSGYSRLKATLGASIILGGMYMGYQAYETHHHNQRLAEAQERDRIAIEKKKNNPKPKQEPLFGMKDFGEIPAKNSDFTQYILLNHHGLPGKPDEETIECQVKMYKTLTYLYNNNKFSAMFVEGLEKGYDINEELAGSSKKDQEFFEATKRFNEEALRKSLSVDTLVDGGYIFQAQNYKDPILFTGWEEDHVTHEEVMAAYNVGLEAKAKEQLYGEKADKLETLAEKIRNDKIQLSRDDMQKLIEQQNREFNRALEETEKDTRRSEEFLAHHTDRTMHMYHNSNDLFSTYINQNPERAKGLVSVVGAMHFLWAGENFANLKEYIKAQETHPRVVFRSCVPLYELKK